MTNTDTLTVYAVVRSDDQGDETIRIFATEELADAYSANHPDEGTYVMPYDVATRLPVSKKYVEMYQDLSIFTDPRHVKGFKNWVADLTPSNLRFILSWTHDDDAFPANHPDVPVGIDRDDTTGRLRVYGTDEDAVRQAFVDNVREMAPRVEQLAAAGRPRAQGTPAKGKSKKGRS